MKKINNSFLNHYFISLNNIKINNDKAYFSSTLKMIYSFFFFYRLVSKKIHNNSLFSFYSYSPNKNKVNDHSLFVHYKKYSFIFYNKDLSYWLNNYIVHERYKPYSLKNSYILEDNKHYIYF